jgi:hypothetical protein
MNGAELKLLGWQVSAPLGQCYLCGGDAIDGDNLLRLVSAAAPRVTIADPPCRTPNTLILIPICESCRLRCPGDLEN